MYLYIYMLPERQTMCSPGYYQSANGLMVTHALSLYLSIYLYLSMYMYERVCEHVTESCIFKFSSILILLFIHKLRCISIYHCIYCTTKVITKIQVLQANVKNLI